jgi:hypothetical protein
MPPGGCVMRLQTRQLLKAGIAGGFSLAFFCLLLSLYNLNVISNNKSPDFFLNNLTVSTVLLGVVGIGSTFMALACLWLYVSRRETLQ